MTLNFEAIFAYFITGILGIITTYIDFNTHFAQARIAVLPAFRLKSPRYCHKPTVIFFIFTILLNCIFLYLLQKHKYFSNEIIWNALISGTGVTALLKSKLFTIQKGETSFGFLWIYEWYKDKVLADLNHYLAGVRLRVSHELTLKYIDVSNIVNRLQDIVQDIRSIEKMDEETAVSLKKDFSEVLERKYVEERDRLASLLRLMMAYTSVDFVNKVLQSLHSE
jgi:hypothetical protein